MRRVNLAAKRGAIAMIELIFSIVVIGIVMLSIPNLIHTAASSGYVALQQEAIATASAQINLIMTKHWDENNTVEAVILRTTNGTPSLNDRNGTVTRGFNLSGGGNANATTIGSELNDFDDMDDYNGTSTTLRNFSDTNITAGDIIDTEITISTQVNYANDSTSSASDYNNSRVIQYNFDPSNATATTNIKTISIELTTNNSAEELSKDIKLQAFSANIGSYETNRREIL